MRSPRGARSDNRSRQRPGRRRQSDNTDRHRSTERLHRCRRRPPARTPPRCRPALGQGHHDPVQRHRDACRLPGNVLARADCLLVLRRGRVPFGVHQARSAVQRARRRRKHPQFAEELMRFARRAMARHRNRQEAGAAGRMPANQPQVLVNGKQRRAGLAGSIAAALKRHRTDRGDDRVRRRSRSIPGPPALLDGASDNVGSGLPDSFLRYAATAPCKRPGNLLQHSRIPPGRSVPAGVALARNQLGPPPLPVIRTADRTNRLHCRSEIENGHDAPLIWCHSKFTIPHIVGRSASFFAERRRSRAGIRQSLRRLSPRPHFRLIQYIENKLIVAQYQ